MAKKQDPKLGEPTRSFLKHKIYGTVYAVDIDLAGDVLAAVVVTEATACRHTLKSHWLLLDDVDEINANLRDYDHFEPVCSDPVHLLNELGEQEKLCQIAETEWSISRNQTKALKETLDQEKSKLFALVRTATTPAAPLPLFDTRNEDAAPPPPSDDARPSDQPSA